MTGDRRPRRAIRLMRLSAERLEDRKLMAVSSQSLLSSQVNLYWSYTDGLYGSFPGLLGYNYSSTSTSTTVSDGLTTTTTSSVSDTYTSTTSGSSGNMTTTWSGEDIGTSTTTVTGTETLPDSSGYTHTLNNTSISRSVVIGSGTYGPNSSSISWSTENWTNQLTSDTATKGYETIQASGHDYSDWYWSGGGPSANDVQPTHETLSMYSVGSGSGSMSVTTAPSSGGYNTFTDVINGGGTTLNESTQNRYDLNANAVATSGASGTGVTSTYSLSTDGSENLSLATTVTQARSAGSGSSSPGSDTSYLNDVSTETFNYTDSGGSNPSSGQYGTFSLTSSGTDTATRQIYGSGSASGASDSYNIIDSHVSGFNSTDYGTRGSSGTDTITDTTTSADTITAVASGVTVRPGQGDGTGTDSYSFNETTHLYKGYLSPTQPVGDVLTYSSTPSGSSTSGVLHDRGDDAVTIQTSGSGNGTMVAIQMPASSSQGTPTSDSYNATETRTRSYALDSITGGSMAYSDVAGDAISGSGSIGGLAVGVSAGDANTISGSVSSGGIYSFNYTNSVFGPTTGGSSEVNNVEYVTRDNPNNYAIHDSATVQHIGGQWTGVGGALTGILDGTLALTGMGIEAKGASDPIVTAILPGDAVPQSGSLEVETPLDTIEGLQQFTEQYGRTTALQWLQNYDYGTGTVSAMDEFSELANPDGTSNLPSQSQTFLQNTSSTISTGRVDTIGGDNTSFAKSIVNTGDMPALNGVYATKTHVYFTPGFYRSDFLISRTMGQAGPKVFEDPFAE